MLVQPPAVAAFGIACTLTIGVPGCLARVRVCRAATIVVRPGELAVVAGPRCAGRTTLRQCLAGMRPPCAGHVCWRTAPPHRVWRGGDVAPGRRRVRALAEPDPWGVGALLIVDDDAPTRARADLLVDRARAGDAVVWGLRAACPADVRATVGADLALHWLADGWLRSR
jgi:energy-coupling factor transporter ATP-binding protein EcfA2